MWSLEMICVTIISLEFHLPRSFALNSKRLGEGGTQTLADQIITCLMLSDKLTLITFHSY